MTAAVVSVTTDDMNDTHTCPGKTALFHLATIHGLPPFVSDKWTPSGVYLALTPETAEAWRAAFGAAPYTEHRREHYSQFKTEVFWMNITVRLSYANY